MMKPDKYEFVYFSIRIFPRACYCNLPLLLNVILITFISKCIRILILENTLRMQNKIIASDGFHTRKEPMWNIYPGPS